MTKTILVDKNNQALLPEEVMEALKLQPGDELIAQIEPEKVILRPKLKSFSRRLRGLHKEVWKDTDAVKYIRNERDSWD